MATVTVAESVWMAVGAGGGTPVGVAAADAAWETDGPAAAVGVSSGVPSECGGGRAAGVALGTSCVGGAGPAGGVVGGDVASWGGDQGQEE